MENLFKACFDFGSADCTDGYVKVSENDVYSKEKGYGFVFEADEKSAVSISSADRGGEGLKRDFCYTETTDVPLRFNIDVPHNGTYNVKVVIGDYETANTVTVQTQSRRFMINSRKIGKGEFIEEEFTVNVCDVNDKEKGRIFNNTINIAVMGDKACINAVEVQETDNAVTVYLAGDSTVTDQTANYPYNPKSTYCGWGQMLGQYLKKGACVSNHALSGLTTQTFKELRWDIVKERIKKSDFLFIQFGHNDQKVESLGAYTGYYENLKYYIDYARSVGATPVVCTPINRIIFEEDGSLRDLLGEYGSAVRSICKEENTACIDLLEKTTEYFTAHGDVDAWGYFWGDGKNRDYTHTNDIGGDVIARFVAQGIVENRIENLCDYVKTDEINVEFPKRKKIVKRTDDNSKELNAILNIGLVNTPKFTDIKGLENEDKIRELSGRGILDCFEESKFASEALLTQKSAVSWAVSSAGVKTDNAEKFAVDSGWIKAVDETAVTKEELAVLVVNSYNYRAPDRAIVGNIDKFTDKNLISDFAVDYVRAAVEMGFMTGESETEFVPRANMNRGSAADIFYRLIKTN